MCLAPIQYSLTVNAMVLHGVKTDTQYITSALFMRVAFQISGADFVDFEDGQEYGQKCKFG